MSGWALTDHSCRICMGRVLHRDDDGVDRLRCAECGCEAKEPLGARDVPESSICWCGVELEGHGSVFECYRNEARSHETPQEVLVRERRT